LGAGWRKFIFGVYILRTQEEEKGKTFLEEKNLCGVAKKRGSLCANQTFKRKP